MASFNEIRRRGVLPAAALCLAAYYLLVFVPLARRAHSLDDPLAQGWRKLAAAVDQTNALSLDFQRITNQLKETRHELALLEDAKKKVALRLELPTDLRAKLGGSFQLVDYQIERSKQIDDLDRMSRQEKVAVDPVVYAGFPEHTASTTDPALLWAALSMTDEMLETALRCKVAVIHSLEVALNAANTMPVFGPGQWAEIALQLEFSGSAENAVRVVQSLPLRTEELKAAGLPVPAAAKLPLLIDRIVIRKEVPEKLDEVRVWVRAVGFVPRE